MHVGCWSPPISIDITSLLRPYVPPLAQRSSGSSPYRTLTDRSYGSSDSRRHPASSIKERETIGKAEPAAACARNAPAIAIVRRGSGGDVRSDLGIALSAPAGAGAATHFRPGFARRSDGHGENASSRSPTQRSRRSRGPTHRDGFATRMRHPCCTRTRRQPVLSETAMPAHPILCACRTELDRVRMVVR